MANLLQRLLFHSGSSYGDIPGEMLSPALRMQADLEANLELIGTFNLPTVVAGRQLIADTAAMMPMIAHDGDDRIQPTPSLLRRPDPAEPYRRTMERIVNQLTRHGMAWLRVTSYGSNGYPLSLEVIDTPRVQYTLDVSQAKVVQASIDGIPAGRELRYIPLIVDDGPIGISPLNAIDPFLVQLAEVYRYSSQFYGSGALPPYAVVHPNRLTADQAQLLSDQWRLARAERRPAILSGNIELEQFSTMSASDAMMLDAINHLDAAVARVLSIPPSLLNTLAQSSLTYSTTEGEFRRWLALGLYPQYLSRIEAAFDDMLPRGTEALFDTSNLTRMDLAGRMEAYASSIAAGIHTADEVRALEGLSATADAIQPNVTGL